jgi:hypothetical protein
MPCLREWLLLESPRGVRGERPVLLGCPHCADERKKLHAWLGLSAGCAAVVEHLLSEPPRRMRSEQMDRCPGTARRPQPSTARTGRGRWRSPCPGQRSVRAMRRSGGGSDADASRRITPAPCIQGSPGLQRTARRAFSCAHAYMHEKNNFFRGQWPAFQRPLRCEAWEIVFSRPHSNAPQYVCEKRSTTRARITQTPGTRVGSWVESRRKNVCANIRKTILFANVLEPREPHIWPPCP